MSLNLFTEQAWLDRIKTKAGIYGAVLAGSPKLPLAFVRTTDDNQCKIVYSGLPLGGVLMNKQDLSALFSDIVINVASFKSTSDIAAMSDYEIFNFARDVVGLTDLSWFDVEYVKTNQELHVTVLKECVKYKGELRIKYGY